MRIDNNLNSMISSQVQLNEMASNIATTPVNITDPQTLAQQVDANLIDSIIGQIPLVIAYSANAKSIETQNATSDMLLNIKA